MKAQARELISIEDLERYLSMSASAEKKLLKSLEAYEEKHKAPDFKLLSTDNTLSIREKLEKSVYSINEMSAYIEDVKQLYKSILKLKVGKFTNKYPLVLKIYEEKKSIYKCQEELKKQGIYISIMQIYNILVRYGVIEKKYRK